jgi:hypothetical protein
LLVHQLPRDAEMAERTQEAERLANGIRDRAERLATITATVGAALNDAAPLVLELASEARQLWEDNLKLDKLTADADIARPKTTRPDAPMLPIAMPLSLLTATISSECGGGSRCKSTP